jgi:hypothetical protein
VTVRWGIAGKGGACMPGQGKASERAYTPEEQAALTAGAAALGLDADTALACLGATTFDVYLNEVVFWSCVRDNLYPPFQPRTTGEQSWKHSVGIDSSDKKTYEVVHRHDFFQARCGRLAQGGVSRSPA